MDSVSFKATTQLENKLSGIYEILYKKETHIASKIKDYSKDEKEHNAPQALCLHLVMNIAVIAGLFHYLY